MSRPRDEKGRFIRADAKPVLHRQVPTERLPIEGDFSVSLDSSPEGNPCVERLVAVPAEPRPDPHGPRIYLRTLIVGVLLLIVLVGLAFMGLAWLASPGGAQ